MKFGLILVFLTTSLSTFAQDFSITGQLVDSLDKPLSGATVMLLNPADSSLVNFTVADNMGSFSLKNLDGKDYLLKATFMGYRSYEKVIRFTPGSTHVAVGQLRMQAAHSELEAIEIAAERAPVTIKKDTIEFNASSFKTRENAMVEELLKKLPGVEVDTEGNITAQGEQVKSVTVDGKKFFGNDPKIATRNLPADAVNKVQVFNKQSDQAVFTGIDDGERQKTINLDLKQEKRNAMFGNLMAGGGTDHRFQTRASLNRFSKGRQLSFLGMGNNVNHSGFGMEDYMNFTGGSRQMMSDGGFRVQLDGGNTGGVPLNFGNRANGLMNTYGGGINMNNEFSKDTEVNGSYFYNYLSHDRDQTTWRENFLQNGTFTFNEEQQERNTNSNHRVNTTLDHRLDSANTVRFVTTFTFNETDSEQSKQSENINPEGNLVSASEGRYWTEGAKTTLNSNLLYRHRFAKKGRSVSANILLGFNRNESTGFLDAINNFYGQQNENQILQQTNDQITDQLNYGVTLSYTEPLGKRKYLEANYNFRANRNSVDRTVFNVTNGEAMPDDMLSNNYNSQYQYHRAGLNFRIAGRDYNFVAGTSLQESDLAGEIETTGAVTGRSFTNILPSLRFHYNFSNTKHLRFDYETSVNEPEIQQLQPVVDNSDPLNIYVGNPALRPAYAQSWRLHFTSFNPVTFMSFFAFADIDYTSNAIVNAQSIDENLVRTIYPVNAGNNLNLSNNVNVGIPLRKMGRFNITGRFRNARSISLINEVGNNIIQQVSGGAARYTYEYKEFFDFSLGVEIERQRTRYNFGQPDQTFVKRTYTAELNVFPLKNYSFNSNIDYTIYKNAQIGFDQRIPLFNVSVSRFLLKNKSAELKLAVHNLLDMALGVEQTASINYIERVTTNSLGRYFMVSFTYALNKQLNPMASRAGRPMIRMRH